MARISNRSRSFRSGIRRSTEWGTFAQTAAVTVPAASDVLVATFPAATLAPVTPGTIVRVRGTVLWNSDQVAANEVQFGAFAIGVVGDPAATAGVASVPVPSVVGWGDDLFFMTMALQNIGASGITVTRQNILAIEFDSKAMRKINDGEALAVTASNWGATGAEIAVSFRILFKKGRSG